MMDDTGGRPPSAQEALEQAVELIRSDRTRFSRLDIETDSMVIEDREQDKRQRIEFIEAATGYMERIVPAGQQFPALAPLLSEIMLFGLRGFKAGRGMEAAFEQAMSDLQQRGQGQGQQGESDRAGDPQADMAKAQVDQARLQLDTEKLRLEREKAEHQANMERLKVEAEQAQKTREHELEVERLRQEQIKLRAELGADQGRLRLETAELADSREARREDREERAMDRAERAQEVRSGEGPEGAGV